MGWMQMACMISIAAVNQYICNQFAGGRARRLQRCVVPRTFSLSRRSLDTAKLGSRGVVTRSLAVSRVASRVRSQSLRGQQNLFVSECKQIAPHTACTLLLHLSNPPTYSAFSFSAAYHRIHRPLASSLLCRTDAPHRTLALRHHHARSLAPSPSHTSSSRHVSTRTTRYPLSPAPAHSTVDLHISLDAPAPNLSL
jgi:hypothetical protein